MNIKDTTKTIVEGFPKQLKGLQIIVDKEDEETFISKDLFVSAVKEYIAQADFWNDLSTLPEDKIKAVFLLIFTKRQGFCAVRTSLFIGIAHTLTSEPMRNSRPMSYLTSTHYHGPKQVLRFLESGILRL